MKKLLDGLHIALGLLCMFGLPSAMLGLSAWFGDTIIGWLHTSASAMHSFTFQIEAILILFGASAGGLALAGAFFAAVWMAVQVVSRMAASLEPLPASAAGRIRVKDEPVAIGRIEHGAKGRRTR